MANIAITRENGVLTMSLASGLSCLKLEVISRSKPDQMEAPKLEAIKGSA